MRTKEEIRVVCEKCVLQGTAFEKDVARTVLYAQDCTWSLKQESIICAGATTRGSNPTAHYQAGDYACDGFDF